MCYDNDARPPLPPIRGAAADAGELTLTSAPADEAARFDCPVLAIYGGADHGIPEAARDAYDQALDAAGVKHRTIVYPDAPHSFFDRRASEFASASEDAWREVLGFVQAA